MARQGTASTMRCSRPVKPKIKIRWARHFARPNALRLLQVSFHHRRDPLMEDLIEQVPARRDHDREALEDDTDENPKAQPTKPRQHLRNAWNVEPETQHKCPNFVLRTGCAARADGYSRCRQGSVQSGLGTSRSGKNCSMKRYQMCAR